MGGRAVKDSRSERVASGGLTLHRGIEDSAKKKVRSRQEGRESETKGTLLTR